MKVYVIGAGALGCAIGGTLAAAGADVTLVNRNEVYVDAINRAGLLFRTNGEDRAINVRAAVDCSGLPPADLVIVLVKSLQTGVAIEAAKGVVGERTTVLSLQNGLGHEDILAELRRSGPHASRARPTSAA